MHALKNSQDGEILSMHSHTCNTSLDRFHLQRIWTVNGWHKCSNATTAESFNQAKISQKLRKTNNVHLADMGHRTSLSESNQQHFSVS